MKTKSKTLATKKGRTAKKSKPSSELRWLLEPPKPGQVHLHVAVGEGKDLPPSVRDSLESLLKALNESESKGGFETAVINCRPRDYCNPEYQGPCRIFQYCKIDV